MKEVKALKGLKVCVEGDEPASCGDGKGGQIGIRPQMVPEMGTYRKSGQFFLQASRFLKETRARGLAAIAVDLPCPLPE